MMSIHFQTVFQMSKFLHNLEAWLDKAVAYAEERSFDPEILLQSRLYPDQYPLIRQIQATCDAAKFAVSYLAGVTAPVHPDTETTFAEIRARLHTTIEYVASFTEDALKGGEEREVRLSFLPGQAIKGGDYLVEIALPNFYFHATTTYSLLRHAGVPLGKLDYIGKARFYEV